MEASQISNMKRPPTISLKRILRAFKQESDRQSAFIAKAELTEQRLFVMVSAFKELVADANLSLLLQAEGLDRLPIQITNMESLNETRGTARKIRSVLDGGSARALSENVARIRKKKRLVDGVCPEAVEVFNYRSLSFGTVRAVMQMKPDRQVKVAGLMVTANNFSRAYAWALLTATPDEQLKEPHYGKRFGGLTKNERRRMELDFESLHRGMKSVERDYGANVIRLVVANGYVMRLLDNDRIVQYLDRNHADLLAQMQAVTESISLVTGTAHQGETPS